MSSSLWFDNTRRFIIPDEASVAPGKLELRTASGRTRHVDEFAVLPFQVGEEDAKTWAKDQLSDTLGEMRGKALSLAEQLRARTEKLREENRKTWEEGVAKAPPEVREAAEHFRSGLRRLGQALRRVAREHGAGKPPTDAKPAPPEDDGAKR